MRQLLFSLILLLPVWLLAGCGMSPERVAEREMVTRAPEIIGPADQYQATVRGVSAQRVEYAQLVGRNVRPQPNLVLDTLTLTLNGVRYQREPFRVLAVDSATFSAQLTEQAVNEYLRTRAQAGNVSNLQVMFRQNLVQATAQTTLQNQPAAVTTSGMLQPAGNAINYVPQATSINGVALTPELQQQLATQINPVISLADVRFMPTIQQITIAPGMATITGTASVMNLP